MKGERLVAPVVVALSLVLSNCATLKTCAKPVEAQAIQDAAGVLVCASSTGKTLAQCEEAQIAVEAGQLTQDALVCGEAVVAAASNGTHAAAPKP